MPGNELYATSEIKSTFGGRNCLLTIFRLKELLFNYKYRSNMKSLAGPTDYCCQLVSDFRKPVYSFHHEITLFMNIRTPEF